MGKRPSAKTKISGKAHRCPDVKNEPGEIILPPSSRQDRNRSVLTLFWACQRPLTKHWGFGQVWDRICATFGTPDSGFGRTDGIPGGVAAYDLKMFRPEAREIWRVCKRLAVLHPMTYPTSWFAGGRREAMVAVTFGPFKMMRCLQIFRKK